MPTEAPLFPIVPEIEFTLQEFQQRASLMGILGDKKLFPQLEEPYGDNPGLVLPEQIQCTPIRIGQGAPNLWIACLQGIPWGISGLSTRDRLIITVPQDKYYKALAITGFYTGYRINTNKPMTRRLGLTGYANENPNLAGSYFYLQAEVIKDGERLLCSGEDENMPIDYKAVFLDFVAVARFDERIHAITVCKPSTPPQTQG